MIGTSLLTLLVASTCGAGVEVRVAPGETLEVDAKAASVASVLECLSQKVGFKLVVESGSTLRQTVTLNLRDQTPTQAVRGVLDSLPVNDALSSDPAGSKILMLVITARSGNQMATWMSGNNAQGGSPPQRPGATPAPMNRAPPEPEIVVEPDTPPDEPPPSFVSPYRPPPYAEALPLSPLSLREARRVHIADSRLPGPASPSPAASGTTRRGDPGR